MSEDPGLFYEFGPFRVNEKERRLSRDGAEVVLRENGKDERLPPKTFDLLLALLKKEGRMVRREELLEVLWPGTFVEDNRLSDNVSTLRKFLGDSARNSQFIETVPKFGYRFVADVREVHDQVLAVVEEKRARILIEETDEAQSLATVRQNLSLAQSDAAASVTPQAKGFKSWKVLVLLAGALIIVGGLVTFSVRRLLNTPASDGRTALVAPEVKITRVSNSGKMAGTTISPDGKFIVYSDNYPDGAGQLYLRQTETNNEIPLLQPGERVFGTKDFSPDGAFIYYIAIDKSDPKGALYRVPILGGPATRLMPVNHPMFSLSPDGNTAAFYRTGEGRRRLILAALDGSGERELLSWNYPEQVAGGCPAWSPDGSLIAFNLTVEHQVRDFSRYLSTFVVNVQSGEQRRLTNEEWQDTGKMKWTPDGKGLVLVGLRPRVGNQLYFVSYPDGAARRITSDLHTYGNYGLGITADSATIVADLYERVTQIWSVGVDGNSRSAHPLTSGTEDGRLGLTELPKGRIAYIARSGDDYDIWTMKGDGTEARPLTADAYRKVDLCATPDGSYLVFVSERAGGSHIFRMNADGSGITQLTFGNGYDGGPDCSPDGKWIVFSSGLRLWKVSIDGGEPLRLTDFSAVAPSYSPDGESIACIIPSNSQVNSASVGIIPAAGGAAVKTFQVIPFDYRHISTRWTPDGKALVYVSRGQNSVANLWRQPIEEGQPQPLTNFKTDNIFSFISSRDGARFILSRGRHVVNAVRLRNFR